MAESAYFFFFFFQRQKRSYSIKVSRDRWVKCRVISRDYKGGAIERPKSSVHCVRHELKLISENQSRETGRTLPRSSFLYRLVWLTQSRPANVWMSEPRSVRPSNLSACLPPSLATGREHYLIMLTSGIGRVGAQGAFPWTWHTIFVLRLLSGRLQAIGRLLPIEPEPRSAKYHVNSFPLRRERVSNGTSGPMKSRYGYRNATIQLK